MKNTTIQNKNALGFLGLIISTMSIVSSLALLKSHYYLSGAFLLIMGLMLLFLKEKTVYSNKRFITSIYLFKRLKVLKLLEFGNQIPEFLIIRKNMEFSQTNPKTNSRSSYTKNDYCVIAKSAVSAIEIFRTPGQGNSRKVSAKAYYNL